MNGLCLNALHDRAFDKGLISIDEGYNVIVSKNVKHKLILQYDRKPIIMPDRFLPDQNFLSFHRKNIFRRWSDSMYTEIWWAFRFDWKMKMITGKPITSRGKHSGMSTSLAAMSAWSCVRCEESRIFWRKKWSWKWGVSIVFVLQWKDCTAFRRSGHDDQLKIPSHISIHLITFIFISLPAKIHMGAYIPFCWKGSEADTA